VASAVFKLFDKDPDIKPWRGFGANGMWEILPPRKDKRGRDVKFWGLPPSAIAVVEKCLLFAETPELLRSLFSRPPMPRAQAPEYRDLMARLDKLGGATAFLRGLLRNEDQLRDALAELRDGKQPAEGSLAQLLRAVLVPHASADDRAKILA